MNFNLSLNNTEIWAMQKDFCSTHDPIVLNDMLKEQWYTANQTVAGHFNAIAFSFAAFFILQGVRYWVLEKFVKHTITWTFWGIPKKDGGWHVKPIEFDVFVVLTYVFYGIYNVRILMFILWWVVGI